MVKLGQRIKTIRKNKGMSQSEVEKRTGIKREYLSKIENSELKNPTYGTIQKICKGIEISVAELLDPEEFRKTRPEPVISVLSANTNRDKPLQNKLDSGEFICIPVVSGETAAANPITINEKDVKEYAVVQSNSLKHTTEYDRYRCVQIDKSDRSMSPIIEPGSMVCIDSQHRDPQTLDNQVIAIKNEDGGCSITRLKVEDKNLLGIPENIKEYTPKVIRGSRFNLIIGKVVWYWTPIE